MTIGGYVVAMRAIDVDVAADRTAHVDVTVPLGVERAFVSPPVPFDRFLSHWIWRDGDGHVVGEQLGVQDARSEPVRLTRRLVPGRYSVEVFGPGGRSLVHEFTVTGEPTSDPVIKLTRPQ